MDKTQIESASAEKPLQVRVDSSLFPRPEVAGFANRCAIAQRGPVLHFDFFEERDARRALIVKRLVMPIDDVVGRLWTSSEQFFRIVKKAVSTEDYKGLIAGHVPPDAVGDSLATVSNLLMVTRQGLDCELRFYYITPTSLHLASKLPATRQPRALEGVPIASVQVALPLIIAILESVESMLPSIAAQLKAMPEFARRANEND